LGAGFISEHLRFPKITDRVTVSNIGDILDSYKPDTIINCIGKTGRPNIDWCERNKTETSIANTVIPIILADECSKRNIHMIHIGSGCIFYGNSNKKTGWDENDSANPKSFYSKTKYSCDLILKDLNNVCTLRIRMPVSSKDNPRNLINKLKSYDKIIDIQNSMTFMDDFERCVDWIIDGKKTGIYHVTNPGTLSAVDIMNEYRKYAPHQHEVIDEQQLDDLTLAKRSNCILDNRRLLKQGFRMQQADDALIDCMYSYFNKKEK
jgi:dTDP-4-dehydrorhamnose reductase